jgi:hypothetical protein
MRLALGRLARRIANRLAPEPVGREWVIAPWETKTTFKSTPVTWKVVKH